MDAAETDESWESYGVDVGRRESGLGRWAEWILVEGDRLYLTLGMAGLAFVLFLALNAIGVVAFVNDDSITRMAGGMIAGSFSLVTLVVSINQLILSREFTAAGEVRDRLSGVMGLRRDVEDAASVPASPAEPTTVLALVVSAIRHRASALADAMDDATVDDPNVDDPNVRRRVERYANSVFESADRFDERLESAEFGTFAAISAAIHYDDSWQLSAARQLRNRHDDSLSGDAIDAFDELIDVLRLFGVVREHFKTTYLQRELTRFSQLTIYCGVPAVVAAVLIGLVYADAAGPAVPVAYLPYVTSALMTIVLTPLALLAAYILRTATIARRTASIGPTIPEMDPEEGPFDVSYGDEG